MKTSSIGLVIIALSAWVPLAAQESEQTIEELYLKSAIKTQIIKAEATAYDRDMKKLALEGIEEMIEEGSASGNPEIVAILDDLAGEGVTTIIREEGLIINDFPDIRREAVRLLGQLGTQQAADHLKTILLTDPEPMVMSEAILAISNIEVEDTVARDRALVDSIYRQTARNKDSNFAYTYLEAVKNIVFREGSINNPAIIEEVAKLADARQGYISEVQKKALKLLQELKEF